MTDENPDKHSHNHKFNSSSTSNGNKMDKKFNPAFGANSKAVTLDSSLKAAAFTRQDGASGSQVSKVQQKAPSRYKGQYSTGNSNPRNNDSYRNNKPSVPRGRGAGGDKRGGKPRGGGGGGNSAAAEAVANLMARGKAGESEPEAGSLQFPGGKKQNFDDMWGFRFAPREGRNLGYGGGGHHHLMYGGQARGPHPPGGGQMRYQYLGGGRGKYAKDYLLANCQFLVRMGEDYTVYLADPNILVKWDLIEQVRIRIDGETPKCPICLDFPVAAKITKCGHIYCWACFLHYLALSDNKVRTCPICYEPVSRKDLKSVTLLSQEGVQVGSRIEMQLMVRAKDSLVAYPVEKERDWEGRFCKILQVAPTTVIQTVLQTERLELDFAFASDPNAPEVCFIQEAIEELNAREIALTALQIELGEVAEGLLPPTVIVSKMQVVDVVGMAEERTTPVEEKKGKTRNDSVSSNTSSCGGTFDESLRQLDAQGDCYFYQVKDGRNVFLHPLNMAMLWRELGSDPEKWPQVLTFEVIDVEGKSATEELRKRMKFLRHLPKNTPFDLVEVSMNEWGISPEIYADFASQIMQREQRRKRRAKEEKNLERKLKDREAAEFNKLVHHPQISSPQEFPAFGESRFAPDLGLTDFPEQLVVDVGAKEEHASDESLTADWAPPLSGAASSFAQIAGKAPLKKSPTFPLPKQGAWGIAAVAAAQVPTHRHQSDSENDGEDYVPVPNYRASVSSAIEQAMAGLDLRRGGGEQEGSPTATGGGGSKKKKNKKGKVLFATGMGGFQ